MTGTSGSGKSTLARRIAAVLDVPYVELDALYHGPDWVPRPTFVEEVCAFVGRPGWVTEWGYEAVRHRLAAAADLIVWLDLPRPRVMLQLTRRTVRRSVRRERLWNGNVEAPLWTFFTDRDHVVRWAWRTHGRSAEWVDAVLGARADLPVVRLSGHAAAGRWLCGPLTEVSRPTE